MKESGAINRLAEETSPYLLQHAHNPVAWYPWCSEALQQAQNKDKPILLSIGYSACHWCHVMAHESFEDGETACMMNQLFVNIKVDREERPDLDKIYQTAHSLLNNRSGGWPLTVFLDPQSRLPFFSGTYFPPVPRHGLPSFRQVLQQIAAYFNEHRDEIGHHNQQIQSVLGKLNRPDSVTNELPLTAVPLDVARSEIERVYDEQHGGFDQAPKFPHPTFLERMLRHWEATSISDKPDKRALQIVTATLMRMADGGIYDQLGGGFYRYAVDEQWMIPHFEKMLYDNAALLALYAKVWAVTRNSLYHKVTEETAQWIMREMQSPEGGYYATLDADSENQEGRFYTWIPEEVKSVLSDREYAPFADRFGLRDPPNIDGRWHLYVVRGLQQLGEMHGLAREDVLKIIDPARHKLEQMRRRRVPPGRDEKVLVAWNGLMIKGMALAGRCLEQERFIESARHAVDFVHANMWQNGRLYAVHKDGQNRYPAYLDDYVFLVDGILELLQVRWRTSDMLFAIELAEAVLNHFEDREYGGFFFTADDHEKLIQRPKTFADEALPAGNGVAAAIFVRLAHLVGERRYMEAAERTLKAAWTAISRMPYAHASLLLALEEFLYPPEIIILRGESQALKEWSNRGRRFAAPRRLIFPIAVDEQNLPGLLGRRHTIGQVTAYICKDFSCLEPITDYQQFEQVLGVNEVPWNSAGNE